MAARDDIRGGSLHLRGGSIRAAESVLDESYEAFEMLPGNPHLITDGFTSLVSFWTAFEGSAPMILPQDGPSPDRSCAGLERHLPSLLSDESAVRLLDATARCSLTGPVLATTLRRSEGSHGAALA